MQLQLQRPYQERKDSLTHFLTAKSDSKTDFVVVTVVIVVVVIVVVVVLLLLLLLLLFFFSFSSSFETYSLLSLKFFLRAISRVTLQLVLLGFLLFTSTPRVICREKRF